MFKIFDVVYFSIYFPFMCFLLFREKARFFFIFHNSIRVYWLQRTQDIGSEDALGPLVSTRLKLHHLPKVARVHVESQVWAYGL